MSSEFESFVKLPTYVHEIRIGEWSSFPNCFSRYFQPNFVLFTCSRPVLEYVLMGSLGVLTSKCILRGSLTIRKWNRRKFQAHVDSVRRKWDQMKMSSTSGSARRLNVWLMHVAVLPSSCDDDASPHLLSSDLLSCGEGFASARGSAACP